MEDEISGEPQFEKASIARFRPEERQAYESSLKYYRDLKNVIDTAREEGREEGEQRAKRETARHLIALGMLTDEQLAAVTGLALEEIRRLRALDAGVG